VNFRPGLVAAAVLLSVPAAARTLAVGEDREYKLPSEAIAAAEDGDTVLIDPGEYFDCAIVRRNDLTIAGVSGGSGAAVLSDKVCEEKALLVLRGNNTVVRNLTLQRARVPDGNGAGIRVESSNLTVDHVRFDNDEVGILSGAGGGTVTVTESTFTRGGVGGVQPKYAIMIANSALLTVSKCTFSDVKGGQITTAATRSVISNNRIGVGAGAADEEPSYAVIATDGALQVEGNVITVGPLFPRPGAAIGLWDGATGVIVNNELVNKTGRSMALVKDWTWGEPTLQGNRIGADDSLVSSSGIWRHRGSKQYYESKAEAHALASSAKQMIKRALGR